MGKKVYPLGKIKRKWAYTIDEICDLYGNRKLHPQTVRGWIKKGLPTIDKKKPTLIFGSELHQFIGTMNASGKVKTEFHEMFCMKCQDARKPYKKEMQVELDRDFLRAKAICSECLSTMNKSYKKDDYTKLKLFFRTVAVLGLYDSTASTVNTHLGHTEAVPVNESLQMEMF